MNITNSRFFMLAFLYLLILLLKPVEAAAAPDFSYAVTTSTDPVRSGEVAKFTVTVTNLNPPSGGDKFTDLYFHVPNSTMYGGIGAGVERSISFSQVGPDESQSKTIDLTVLGQTTPDGTIVTLSLLDKNRAAYRLPQHRRKGWESAPHIPA